MMGMDNITGKVITGQAYLQQRLTNALTTNTGSTVMLRNRGSRLFEMTDRGVNAAYRLEMYAAINEAVNSPLAGLPDFKISQTRMSSAERGKPTFYIEGEYLPEGRNITLAGIEL